MKTNQYLVDFYNNYDENSRLEKKHGSVEFLTTMRYIKRYIKAGDHVLEIGAGTGRYSHTLARQGYTVDAVASSRSRPWAQIWSVTGNNHRRDASNKETGISLFVFLFQRL